MIVRALAPGDRDEFHRLRLECLQREPGAFLRTVDEYLATSAKETDGGPLRPSTDGSRTYGGAVDGRLVGLVGLTRAARQKQRHRATLWGMYVTPSARGRGIGRALLEALVRDARSVDGLEQLHLAAFATQTAAIALYAAVGFVRWGVEPRAAKIGDEYVDDTHMMLRLHA